MSLPLCARAREGADAAAPGLPMGAREHPGGARRAPLDGGRWHFQHGPIDLVIGADGDAPAVAAALQAAWQRIIAILPELAAELPLLRRPARGACLLQGAVARRMFEACSAHAPDFITPMAAVAGSVADELIACFDRPGVSRAYVNNGGDIALHLAPGQTWRVGLFSDLARYAGQAAVAMDGEFALHAALPVRGVATSGWRGRSFSMGIADSVTVLAATAAAADAAATMVANEVDAEHPAVRKAPADSLKDDTDLEGRLVTVQVGTLPRQVVQDALRRGLAKARQLERRGLIHGAVLMLQGSAAGTKGICMNESIHDGMERPKGTLCLT